MPWNIVASKVSHWYWNTTFLNAIRGAQDFIGLNHYFYKRFGGNGNLPKSDMGWDIFPDAIYHCLIDLKKYAVPIYITENGIADRTDSKRAEFIKGYLSAVLRAIQDAVQVKGYLYWSLLDNYEWAFGFTERFGLIEVHPETLTRLVRPSAYVYKEIIDKNSIL
jgi:beta-glucosidase/6-phospho-beta-glucosidase/beta-galactosidase